jgi:hypothetical protein
MLEAKLKRESCIPLDDPIITAANQSCDTHMQGAWLDRKQANQSDPNLTS